MPVPRRAHRPMNDYQRTLDWLYALEAAKGMDFKLDRVSPNGRAEIAA